MPNGSRYSEYLVSAMQRNSTSHLLNGCGYDTKWFVATLRHGNGNALTVSLLLLDSYKWYNYVS